MSDFHIKKAEKKAGRKLIFSQKSLDDWKAAQLERMRAKVSEEVRKQFESQQKRLDEQKESITEDATNHAFMLLLGIPCKVMKEQFGWGKARLSKLGDYILEYYSDFQDGDMSIEEYRKMIWEETGIGFTIQEEGESEEEASERYGKEMDGINGNEPEKRIG